ncbi:MAG: hypothetical protein AABN34_19450 [Acidobacteriota bacterium]
MNKRAMAFFMLVFVTLSANSQALSQSKCSLTKDNSPSVRGLRLGMSTEQLLALFPGSATRWAKEPKTMRDARERAMAATSNETAYLSFDPATDAAKEPFAGVDSVSAGLYSGRVIDFSVLYLDATFRTIDEWVAKLSETFKLPGAQDWVVGSSENPHRVLKCAGIEIEAAIQGGSASIRLRNTDVFKAMQEFTTAAEEKKRREIKP